MLSFKKFNLNLTNRNKLISPPYVNETILRHNITIEELVSYSNIKLNRVRTIPQMIEILIEFLG
tara:strand:+ start:672 stop:863 length:192 start_codon:yes stop_codon:yes gene_type:complete